MSIDIKDNKDIKKIIADKQGKIPYEYLVYGVLGDDALCHKLGADKYGKLNWRKTEIKASTYVAAIMRHLIAYNEKEDTDKESGLSHLSHIRACCAILLDANKHDTLFDDRDGI